MKGQEHHRRTLSGGSVGPLGLAAPELKRAKNILDYDTPAVQSLYRLESYLRKPTGSSVLRKAVHVTTEQAYVCKTIHKRTASSAELETVRQEAQIMQLLKKFPHPNILSLIDAVEDDKAFHLVSEGLHGQSLLGLVAGCGPYEEEEAKEVFVQCVRAVHHLHRLGIIHRGVTMDSFVFNSSLPDRLIKLTSFQTAIRMEDTDTSKPYINHYYAAPEVFEGKYVKATDVYSLGVILYTMLAGYHPYSGANRIQTIDLILSKEPPNFEQPPWNSISMEAKSLIRGLLSEQPADRPSTETVLQNSWLPASKFRNVGLSRAVFMELIASPKSQNRSSALVKSLLTQLPAEDMHSLLSRIDELFEAFDPEHTGGLTIAQLEEGLQDYSISMLQLHSVFKRLDMDQDGVVSYEEFLAGIMAPALLHSNIEAVQELTRLADSQQQDQNVANVVKPCSPPHFSLPGDLQSTGDDQFPRKSHSFNSLVNVPESMT